MNLGTICAHRQLPGDCTVRVNADAARQSFSLAASCVSVAYFEKCECPVSASKLDRYWSVKGEYLFVDLGTRTINTRDIDGVPFRVSYTVRDHIARIGLNYAFGP
jgi:hypothetical protein